MTAELRMLRMRFDTARLFLLGRRRRLPVREVDLGYLLHCELKELFGEDAPAPFALRDVRGRFATVLAYSMRTLDELREHATAFADPAVYAACDVAAIEEKPMPSAWTTGRRVEFEARLCPVVRVGNGVPRYRKGAEVDVFLVRAARTEGQPIDREVIYREWLGDEVSRRGGAKLVRAELTGFQRERLLRRDHGSERSSHASERPDVKFTGELEITDGERFAALLARGLGRHRAFGFGMVLLRPPR